jgi:hypothetical protein
MKTIVRNLVNIDDIFGESIECNQLHIRVINAICKRAVNSMKVDLQKYPKNLKKWLK